MTEALWEESVDPTEMLRFLGDKASDRKLRLFGCACCRRIWHLLTDERSRECVEVAERYADGPASGSELRAASAAAWEVSMYSMGRTAAAAEAVAEVIYEQDAYGGAYHISLLAYNAYFAVGEDIGEYDAQCHLLRDIFGNLFRPVALDPAWRTSTVVALAEGIYAERAFDRMSILADALQDAGCADEDVLAHCRDTTLAHVRGCWVVDLVLGKA